MKPLNLIDFEVLVKMSAIYDNWERLVAAVVKKQQLWELFHEQSRSPSILSEASDFSASSLHDLDFDFSNLEISSKSQIWPPSNLVLVSDFCPALNVKDVVAKASTQLLGRGTFGSAYVVSMSNDQRFVVKRVVKLEGISEMDFKRYMEIIGDVKHDNVVALRAYYSSPDHQKLMLYDYYSNGSMFSLLYGKNRGDVDWETRLKIAIGAARGIAEIHKQLGGMLAHGNIKASNILLNLQWYGCVSDFGLTNTTTSTSMPSAKWYAPLLKSTAENVSQASDVFSFGVVLLELVTRKSTSHVPGAPAPVDLVKLVDSVKSKERAAKVFDPDLLKHPSISKQMIQMLEIGMRCVAKSAKKRPKILEVVKMLEDIVVLNPEIPSLDSKHQEGRLVFLEDANPVYGIEEIMRASAEVLGKGTFGTSYKARLENGYSVVVKRLRKVKTTFKEFQQHMKVFERMNHINVGRPKAYYYSRGEKLLLCDYYNQGSLSAALHGFRATFIEWESRVKIAYGAARGIAHIHGQDGLKLVLGNIKSTNIFLSGENHSIIAFDDAVLVKLMNPEKLSPDYCAPEVKNSRNVSQASDVYSFGVVLLELVSGRPSQDLAEWIRSVDRSDWIPEVLDIKLLGYGNDQQELMMKLLQIAVDCVRIVPKHRPTIFEVVKVLEEISGVGPETILELSSEISGLESESILDESSIQSGLEYLLEDLLPLLSP